MPSLNISLSALSVLPAGSMPVAANPIAPAMLPPGEGFAGMMASIGDAPMIDGMPVPKPAVGTTLPPERQEVAAASQALPPPAVEDVMLGAALPAFTPEPKALTGPDGRPKEEEQADLEPASTPDQAIGVTPDWDIRGASRRALARATLNPQPRVAVELPPENIPDLVLPVAVEPQESADNDKAAQPTVQEQQRSEVPVPAFAPAEWIKPAPATTEGLDAPVVDTGPFARSMSQAGKPQADKPQATQPASASAGANLPANAGVDHPDLPVKPESPAQPALTPSTAKPVHAPAPSALPQSFALPPELAREIAEVVRATGSNRDDSAPLPRSPESTPLPATPVALQPSSPLHRDFAPAQRPVIDTSRGEWMQAMIERIAEMPQADGKREAQIRLLPDNLGAVEVKIVERQDRLHVTLNTDNPQARQLLADAAPRLHELAEARGLRLGQTNVGGGESQDRRPTPEQQQPATPLRPRSARAGADISSEPDGDLIA